MAPSSARRQNNPSRRPFLLLVLLALLPTLSGAQVRDWAVTYDSGSAAFLNQANALVADVLTPEPD